MNRRIRPLLVAIAVAAAVLGGAAYYRYTHPLATKTPVAATAPATSQDVKPIARAAKPDAKGPTTQLLDILRAADPKYPTTRRMELALDLRYAARITLDDPVYLDPEGNLWVTRPHDGPAQFDFAKAGRSDTATHVVRDRVAYVLWAVGDRGAWMPNLVVRAAGGDGYELVNRAGRRPLADPYGFRWNQALTIPPAVQGAPPHVVVPTATGACAFTFDQPPAEILAGHQALFDAKLAGARAVHLVSDTEGVIAFNTDASGKQGQRGVARFAPARAKPATAPTTAAAAPRPPPADPDAPPVYKWTVLTGQPGWSDRLLHLVPFLDGSVLQVAAATAAAGEEDDPAAAPGEAGTDKLRLSLMSVGASAIDRRRVRALIRDLSADEPDKRDAAYKALTTFGPGITPILEREVDDQPAEARTRIRQLLKNSVEASLGGLTLVDGKARVVNRLPDGGVILYAPAGVARPRADQDTPDFVVPAWISIRPGNPIDILRDTLVADLDPATHRITPWGPLDYVVTDPVIGPQAYVFNKGLEPLLRKRERAFTEFAGIDTTGRWIFRKPAGAARTAAAAGATGPTSRNASTNPATTEPTTKAVATTTPATQDFPVSGQTLILDPHLPDPTPRLPAWQLPASAGKVGWDKDGWPVIYIGGGAAPVPWALQEDGWRVIDEKKETVLTEAKDLPPAPTPPQRFTTTKPATTTATTTTTTASTRTTAPTTDEARADGPDDKDFLLAADGVSYYNGRDALTVVRPDGSMVTWPLPPKAVAGADAKPLLFRTRDGLLFLVNAPGRVARIRPATDGDAGPGLFELDAVFTRGVPSDPNPLRVWLDPAGRICYAAGNRVTVLFTEGRIPPAIAEKMRPEDFPENESDE